jgi:hypothetical protein
MDCSSLVKRWINFPTKKVADNCRIKKPIALN